MATKSEAIHDDLVHFQNYKSTLHGTFTDMFHKKQMTDAILQCENQQIHVHRILLSISSEYFNTKFRGSAHGAVLHIKHLKYHDLSNVLEYIYVGEVSLERSALKSFQAAAKFLKVEIDHDSTELSHLEECHKSEGDSSDSEDFEDVSENGNFRNEIHKYFDCVTIIFLYFAEDQFDQNVKIPESDDEGVEIIHIVRIYNSMILRKNRFHYLNHFS